MKCEYFGEYFVNTLVNTFLRDVNTVNTLRVNNYFIIKKIGNYVSIYIDLYVSEWSKSIHCIHQQIQSICKSIHNLFIQLFIFLMVTKLLFSNRIDTCFFSSPFNHVSILLFLGGITNMNEIDLFNFVGKNVEVTVYRKRFKKDHYKTYVGILSDVGGTNLCLRRDDDDYIWIPKPVFYKDSIKEVKR